jgi:hypothetical protein
MAMFRQFTARAVPQPFNPIAADGAKYGRAAAIDLARTGPCSRLRPGTGYSGPSAYTLKNQPAGLRVYANCEVTINLNNLRSHLLVSYWKKESYLVIEMS